MSTEQAQYIKNLSIEYVIGKHQNPLDYPVTEKELMQKIQALPTKKASGQTAS